MRLMGEKEKVGYVEKKENLKKRRKMVFRERDS